MEDCQFVNLENSIWKTGQKGEGEREGGRRKEETWGGENLLAFSIIFAAASCFFLLTLSMKGTLAQMQRKSDNIFKKQEYPS